LTEPCNLIKFYPSRNRTKEKRIMLHPAYRDSWNDMLHDKIECNASISLYAYSDQYPDANGKPYICLFVDMEDTDSDYFGSVIGYAVFDWWEATIDDVDFPTPMSLLDEAMETYCGSLNGATGACTNDWVADAWSRAAEVVERSHHKYMDDVRQQDHDHMLRHGYRYVGYDYVKD
jgi:hypothetical protein